MRQYKQKKIWLNYQHTKYCWVRLYADQLEMQKFYKAYCVGWGKLDKNHFKVKGVSLHYSKVRGRAQCHPETGIVLLCFQHSGAGIVSHELGHAVLWARKHWAYKKQHPIVIKNLKQEEEFLHHLTYAITQFYNWYWTIEKLFKPKRKSKC